MAQLSWEWTVSFVAWIWFPWKRVTVLVTSVVTALVTSAKVTLHQVWLVLGMMTVCCCTIYSSKPLSLARGDWDSLGRGWEKKQRVLCNSRPSYQDCLSIDWSWLKVMAVNWTCHHGVVCYVSVQNLSDWPNFLWLQDFSKPRKFLPCVSSGVV